MSDHTDSDLDRARANVRSSDTRVEILRELYAHSTDDSEPPELRPSELVEVITPRTGKSDTNVYQSLNALVELSLVKKIDSDGRATLYSLTDRGKQVAEDLGLTGADSEIETESEAEEGSSSIDESEIEIPDGAFDPEEFNDTSGDGALNMKMPRDMADTSESKPPSEQAGEQRQQATDPSLDAPDTSQQQSLLPHMQADKDIDPERVDQIANELKNAIYRTNLSIHELEAAIDRLKQESE
jgi:DNA-binding transcriptional ArsR family regulator